MTTMQADFTDWKYLWPPRPTVAVTPAQFHYFQHRGFVTQYKLNGQCAIIGLGPDNRLELWNRHEEELRWAMPAETHLDLRGLLCATDSPYWTVVVGELLHAKVSGGPKNTLYLFDVLVFAGQYLVGTPYSARHGLLVDRFNTWKCPKPKPLGFKEPGVGILAATPNIWIADNMNTPLAAFNTIQGRDFREGIVMKNPDARLEACITESANSRVGVKCRYATKNFAF